MRHGQRDHRLKRLRVARRAESRDISKYAKTQLNPEQRKGRHSGLAQINICLVTTEYGCSRPYNQGRYDNRANDMRDYAESLVAKSRAKHQLYQDGADGRCDKTPERRAARIRFDFSFDSPL